MGARTHFHCTIPGCGKVHKAHGLCGTHYRRLLVFGSTDLPPVSREKPVCRVDGCDRPSRSLGYCNMHRLRLTTTGEVGEPETRKGKRGAGTVSPSGYRYVCMPEHPNAGKNGTLAEHVIVMARVLGRPLRKGETVHHKNGIRLDNRPENLELWASVHPAGQSVLDMIEFCESYLAEYGHLKPILQPASESQEK